MLFRDVNVQPLKQLVICCVTGIPGTSGLI